MKTAHFTVPVQVLDRHAQLSRQEFDLSDEFTVPVSSDELALLQSGGSVEVEVEFS